MSTPTPDTLAFFATHGPISDPGAARTRLDGLPTDLGELCRVVQGLQVHVFGAERYGLPRVAARKAEVQLRTLPARLARLLALDDRPLTVPRPLDKRLVGNCRDFSLLLAAILRHQGTPARARCGFGTYFLPNHYEDHWVCEVWRADLRRWVLVDAQLDPFQCETLRVDFDPLDVPRDRFIVGGQAWQLCRAGAADPETFGIFDMHGLWFVRGDFVRDVAALNKVELLPWDSWGVMEVPDAALTPDDLTFLDRLAELTAGDVPDLATVRGLYAADARVCVPPTFHSYTDQGMLTVELAA